MPDTPATATHAATPPSLHLPLSAAESDVIDARGFAIIEVPNTAILHGWSEKHPKLRHWANGGEGQTYVELSEEEQDAIAAYTAEAVNDYPALAAMREALEKIDRASPPDNSDVSLALFAMSLQDIARAALRLAQPAAADAGEGRE